MDNSKEIKIVIAEDSLTQAEQLKYVLEKEGFRVYHGLNGNEAFDIIRRVKPQIIISDIVMPGLNGFDLCKLIKDDKILKSIPVILLTSLDDPTDIIKGLEYGADNYITKPYSANNLIQRIRTILVNIELRQDHFSMLDLEIFFGGKKYKISSERIQILDLLLSTFEISIQQNKELKYLNDELITAKNDLAVVNKELEKKVEKRTARLNHLNKVLHSIRNVNQLIVQEKQPAQLILKTSKLLTEQRGYKTAWISLVSENGQWNKFAESGIGKKFLTYEKEQKSGKISACCQKVLKTPGILFNVSLEIECGDCPLYESDYGQKMMFTRLCHEDRIYGMLAVSLPEEIIIDEEETSLFEEVAGDLGFAMHDIELAKEHRKINVELQKRTHDLNERVKELNCLYGIDEISTLPGIKLPEIFNETIRLIQSSWQYPEITAVKITFEGKDYQSDNFKNTKWLLKSDLIVNKQKEGSIEVYYLKKKPDLFSGPFMEEEMQLLQRIVMQLDKFIIRLREEKELVVAKVKAEKADKLKSAFLMNMSHEIRTPMNAIIGFSELLSDPEIINEQKKEFIDIIQDNGSRLLHLIDDILDISKVESDSLTIELKEISIHQLFSELLTTFENLKGRMGKNEIEIRVKPALPERDLVVKTDPFRVRQILSNLLDNALKYTEKGMIEFGYSIIDQKHKKNRKDKITTPFIKFYVKDSGIGIPEEQTEFIFDRFMKVEDKMKLYGGAGLGLTLSKNLANILGGEIWVESVLGQGSTFYFTIPGDKSTRQSTERSLEERPSGKFEWSDKIILVAEDEESNYLLLQYILEKTNAKIYWVKNGKEAVDFCKSNNGLDLIIMDIKMPKMDGLTATQLIRKINTNLPIIALTAFAAENDRDESIRAGCSDYMTKPISPDKLLILLNKYMKNDIKIE